MRERSIGHPGNRDPRESEGNLQDVHKGPSMRGRQDVHTVSKDQPSSWSSSFPLQGGRLHDNGETDILLICLNVLTALHYWLSAMG